MSEKIAYTIVNQCSFVKERRQGAQWLERRDWITHYGTPAARGLGLRTLSDLRVQAHNSTAFPHRPPLKLPDYGHLIVTPL